MDIENHLHLGVSWPRLDLIITPGPRFRACDPLQLVAQLAVGSSGNSPHQSSNRVMQSGFTVVSE